MHWVLAGGLAVCWVLYATLLRDNAGLPVRAFVDDYDHSVYAERGSWAPTGRLPYRDAFSEYPPLATYVFALPYLVVGNDRVAYRAAFSLLMAAALYGTIVLLWRMLPTKKSRAYLLLLPAGLYFSLNRFDLLASGLALLSLRCLGARWSAVAGACLGAAALTKWYPALLLPVYLSYEYRQDRAGAWRLLLAFGATAAALMAPLAALGGLETLLRPYAFHAGRGLEMVALPALVSRAARYWAGVDLGIRLPQIACLLPIAAAVVASAVARVDTVERVTCWALTIAGMCVLLSTIWSPQWILWVLPLMILTARPAGDLPWVVAYGILTYVAFPLFFDAFGHQTWHLAVVALALDAILLRTVVVAHRRAVAL